MATQRQPSCSGEAWSGIASEHTAAHGFTLLLLLLLLLRLLPEYLSVLCIQRGVSAGRVLIVAQRFGLENQLFEATTQARAEGGYGVDLHHDLPDRLETPMRKPRQRRADRKPKAKSKAGSTSTSPPSSSKKSAAAGAAAAAKAEQQQQQLHQQQQGNCGAQQQLPALKMTPIGVEMGPGGPAASIGSVSSSLLSLRGKDSQDPSKPATTPTQLSEVMDVTALWLLSIMLFFPAWSTFCLVWRKMIKRRWALQESVARIRRAVCSMAKFKREAAAATAPAADTAAATAAAAAATTTPQRSAGSASDSKGPSSKAGAAPRQQRKVGPSIALPGSAPDPRLSAKASSPTGGGLSRAISAPEASFRAHLTSLAKAAQEVAAEGATGASLVRRQRSNLATVVAASPDVEPVASGVAHHPAATKPTRAGAAAAATAALDTPLPPLQRSISAAAAKTCVGSAAATAAAAAAAAAGLAASTSLSKAGAAGASASSSTAATAAAAAAKNKRNKQSTTTPAAVASPVEDTDISKADAAPQPSKHAAAAQKASSSSAAKAPALDCSTTDTSSSRKESTAAAPRAAKQAQVLLRSSTTVQADPATHCLLLEAAAADQEATSPVSSTGSSSRLTLNPAQPRKPTSSMAVTPSASRAEAYSLQAALSPSSGRFTVPAAAAAAAAAREAAAAAAAATAALRRTASGGVVTSSSRSPVKDLDDVWMSCRDQDRPQAGPGADADTSSHDLASSAPSGNAWTPAAAAARAARAAGASTKYRDTEDSEHPAAATPSGSQPDAGDVEGSDDAAAAAQPAAAQGEEGEPAAPAAAVSIAASTADGRICSSSSSSSAGSNDGTLPVQSEYADSFTAAAVAAGILPSPTGSSSTTAPGSQALASPPGLWREHEDTPSKALDDFLGTPSGAAPAPLASPIGATIGTANGSSMHSPVLDPPVVLLPGSLLSRLDAAPGRVPSGPPARSISALEPKVLHDLADLVAASIAQEVQARTGKQAPAAGAAGPAAAAPGATAGSSQAADHTGRSEARTSDPGSKPTADATGSGTDSAAKLTGVVGPQLVHQTLDEVFALIASKPGAATTAAGSNTQLPTLAEEPAGPAAAPPALPGAEEEFFKYSGATLFADLAQKLKLPARHSPEKNLQQQQQQQQPDARRHVLSPDQHPPWFAGAPVSGPMAATAGLSTLGPPPGLMSLSQGMVGASSLPSSVGPLGPPPGLQQAAQLHAVPVSLPPGAIMSAAPSLPPMQQPQQQVRLQQQVVSQAVPSGMLVTMAPGQQPVQVVAIQPVAAGGPAQGPIIRLANGQLVQGQLVQMHQGQQMNGVPVVAAHAGGPVMVAHGGVLNMQQPVNPAPQPSAQPQLVPAHRVFYPQGYVQGSMQGAPQVHMVAAGTQHQQQQMVMPAAGGAQLVKVQLPGGVLHNMPVQHGPQMGSLPQGSMGLAAMAMPVSQGKQQVLISSSQSSSGVGGAVKLGSTPPRVTVLEAPAGPAAAAPGQPAAAGPERLQKMLSQPQRHQDTGVYVSWPASQAPKAAAEAAAAAAPAAVAEQQLQPSESAQMAAELDELLHQVRQPCAELNTAHVCLCTALFCMLQVVRFSA